MNRVVIFGAPGSGKSTLATQLAKRTGALMVERDALGPLGSDAYRTAVETVVGGDRWIFDGAPYYVDDLVYGRADTVIILDFPKPLIMKRVITRSLGLLVRRQPVGAHQPGGLWTWRDPNHPVRIAWTRYADRRQEARALLQRPDLQRAQILTFMRPGQLAEWLDRVPQSPSGPQVETP